MVRFRFDVPPKYKSTRDASPEGQRDKAEEEPLGKDTGLSVPPRRSRHRTCTGVTRELTLTA